LPGDPPRIVPAIFSDVMLLVARHDSATSEGPSIPNVAPPENDPVALPPLTVVGVKVAVQASAVHSSSVPITVDRSVPPPESVSAAENDTVPDGEQLTAQCAAPVNVGMVTGLAAAGWASG